MMKEIIMGRKKASSLKQSFVVGYLFFLPKTGNAWVIL